MLVINPDECIDCGVCVPECPADAISADTADGMEKWVDFNKQYAERWPIIYLSKEPLSDADDYEGEPDKLATRFSDRPAQQVA